MAAAFASLHFDRHSICNRHNLNPDNSYRLFMPGSRPKHFQPLFPYFVKVINHLKTTAPNIHPLVLKSPFIGEMQ